MKIREFKDIDGDILVIKARKNAVFFEESKLRTSITHNYEFDEEAWKSLIECLDGLARQSWENFQSKEADSLGADYDSYWDKELDNEGNLTWTGRKLLFDKPDENNVRLYKFNKRKMESFIYDIGGIRA